MYEGFHTTEDVMREYLIQVANLDEYGVPELYPINVSSMDDTIDFSQSFNCRIKNHKKLNVNFYIHDKAFERIWNNTDRYIEHLKCFHSVIAPDFSISTGRTGMTFAINLWNKYRNLLKSSPIFFPFWLAIISGQVTILPGRSKTERFGYLIIVSVQIFKILLKQFCSSVEKLSSFK